MKSLNSQFPWYTLPITFVTVPMLGMAIDLYVPSMPAIAVALSTSGQLVKLTLLTYLIGYMVGILFFGPWSDTVGRKKSMLIGIGIFSIASFIAVFTKSIGLFLILRLFQGIGIGSIGACFRAIISDMNVSEEQQQHINAIYTIIGILSPTFAPVIGGYLQHYINWQAGFIFYTVYGVMTLGLLCFMPETNLCRRPFNFKMIMSNIYKVLSNLKFWSGIILMSASYTIIIVFSAVSPFLIQNVLGYNAVQYGHIVFFLGLMLFFGTILYRYLLKFYQAQQLLISILWICLLLVLLILIAAIFLPVNLWYFVLPIAALYFFMPGLFPYGTTIAMRPFSHIAGIAGALTGCLFVGVSMLSAMPVALLHSNNALWLAITYVLVVIVCWLVYLLLLRRYFHEIKSGNDSS